MTIDGMFVLTAIGSIAAALAVIAAWMSVIATQRAAEGQLLLTILKEYSDPEMANALRSLGAWRNDHDAKHAESWKAGRDAKDPLAMVCWFSVKWSAGALR